MKSVIIIWTFVLLTLLGLIWIVDYAPKAHGIYMPASEKYDGDCQPTATVGRCADKPVQAAEPQTTPLPAVTVYGGK